MRVECPSCGAGYNVPQHLAGKKIRCKTCGEAVPVPEDVDDDLDDVEAVDDEPAPRRRKPASRGSSSPNWLLIGGAGAALVLLLGCCGVGVFIARIINEDRPGPPVVGPPPASPIQPFAPQSVPVPKFPELGPAQGTFPSGVTKYWVDLSTAGNAPLAGHTTGMMVYLPRDIAGPQSLPCVLVAPAGTNLLQGNSVTADNDYHVETLPYAEAGYAVVFYSIDGPLEDEDPSDAQFAAAYRQFRDAGAGVVNGRNALEFVLQKLPQVDPQRIYVAGHSSAGTLSLLLAAHEPRLRGCIAYAPCTDVESRLKPVTRNRAVRRVLSGVEDFVRQSSPLTHVDKITCPVFLFHATDDGNVQVSETMSFANRLQQHNRKVTLKTTIRGGHYDAMKDEGIAAAIQWLGGSP